jgi:hypothetical protein
MGVPPKPPGLAMFEEDFEIQLKTLTSPRHVPTMWLMVFFKEGIFRGTPPWALRLFRGIF